MREGSLVVVVVGLLGWPGDARAEGPEPKRVRVSYLAPGECPDAGDFVVRLEARSANVRVVARDESAPELVVKVSRGTRGTETHGTLSIRYPDGPQARRTVDGDTCDSVVDALALMSAMAIDPAGVQLPPKPAPTVPPEPRELPERARPTEPSSRPDESSPSDLSAGTHVAFGAGAGAVFGTAPVPTADVTVFVELARQNGHAWSPSVRASFDYANSGSAIVPGGGMQVVRALGALDGCPVEWSGGPFRLLPCGHAEAGELAASGLLVTPARSASRPWVAAGAVARVRYVPGRRFFVEVTGGALAPFVRDRFFFEPNDTVFRPPPVSGFASGALGLTIP